MTKVNDDNLIKKDLYEIYENLYSAFHANKENNVFDSEFVKKFKYLPSEVAKALKILDSNNLKKENSDKSKNIRNEILNISSIDLLREFYYKELSQIFDANIDEDDASKILNSISVHELKYLYSLISSIPIKSRKNKKDIIYMFKYYFDDEARADAMAQTLK